MSKVRANSGATGEEFEALREKAREMGAKTKYSATEATEHLNIRIYGDGCLETYEMPVSRKGIMNLAAASRESLAPTSDIVAYA